MAPILSASPARKVLYLLVTLGLLQLAISLFTYGFCLYDDEAIWHYIGRNWLRWGLIPYRGGFDNKSPLIFLIFGVSDLLFGVNYWFPRVVGTVVETIGIWYLFKITARMAGRRAGILAMSMYGLALLWRSTEGRYPSLTETYEVTCTLIAVHLFLNAKGKRGYFLSGLSAGLGFAFRLTGIVGIAAILLFSFRRRGSRYFAAGVVVCIALLLGAGALAGIHLKDLWQNAFLNNVQGGPALDKSLYLTRLANGFFHSELVLFYPPVLAYFLVRKKPDILLVWLAGGCLCILALGSFTPAHFKDILPPLAVCAAVSIDGILDGVRLPFRTALAVLWVCFFPKDTEPLLSALEISHPAAGTPQSYCAPPYSPLTNYARKELGLWIKSNTRPDETVYVATGPTIFIYTERQCPSIYFTSNYWEEALNTFYRQMNAHKPDLLAIPLNPGYIESVGAEQWGFLRGLAASAHYRADTCMYGYTIYRKK